LTLISGTAKQDRRILYKAKTQTLLGFLFSFRYIVVEFANNL